MLHEQEHAKQFLVIKHNAICFESKEPVDGWEPVEYLNPRTQETGIKYVKKFKAVEGYVDKVEWYRREDAKTGVVFAGWKVHLSDGEEQYILDIPFGIPAYGYFVKAAENIDWTQKVSFSAWKNKEDGKTAFAARQGDQTIKQKYSAAHPGDCPAPIEKRTPTGTKWDYSDQEIWLKDRMEKVVLPAIDKAAQSRAAYQAQAPTQKSAPPPAAKSSGKAADTEPEWPDPNYDDDMGIPF